VLEVAFVPGKLEFWKMKLRRGGIVRCEPPRDPRCFRAVLSRKSGNRTMHKGGNVDANANSAHACLFVELQLSNEGTWAMLQCLLVCTRLRLVLDGLDLPLDFLPK